MKILVLILISLSLYSFGQESLLLGEVKLDEIEPPSRTDNVKKELCFGYKYSKKGKYKDSTIQSIRDYSKEGLMLVSNLFYGKKNSYSHKDMYSYDQTGRVISYNSFFGDGTGVNGTSVEYSYNSKGQVARQLISLANIVYEYYPDGRLRSKSYYYNNRGEIDSEPWVILFEYDSLLNLIHADADTTGSTQTSFYNGKNELIEHHYYIGTAYTKYKYDDLGNCIEQTDFELGKKGWDSTTFYFTYDEKSRLVLSSASGKKGKVFKKRQWIYNESGQLSEELMFRRNKPKRRYKYYLEYFKE